MSFSAVGATAQITGTNAQPNTRPNITCHRCNRTGHFASTCAEVKGLDGTVLATEGVTMHKGAQSCRIRFDNRKNGGVSAPTAVAPPEGLSEGMVKKYGTHRRSGLRACKDRRAI